MKDLFGLMKQAQQMQSRMQNLQADMEAITVTGAAGGGLVTVTLNGKGDMKQVRVDDSLINPEEVGILEDLIVAAHTDAKAKAEQMMKEKMQEITGGLQLPPGMKLPF